MFTVTVDDGDCRIVIGRTERRPDVVYEMDAEIWAQMAAGLATGDEAVLLGKLRIKGNPDLGRKFNDFFTPPGNPPVRAASRSLQDTPPSRSGLFRPLMGRVLRRARAA